MASDRAVTSSDIAQILRVMHVQNQTLWEIMTLLLKIKLGEADTKSFDEAIANLRRGSADLKEFSDRFFGDDENV